MRVVFLVEELCVGGLSNYALEFSRLAKEFCSSVVIAHKDGITGPALETEGIDIVHVSSVEDIRALNPDIVHVHLMSDQDFLDGLFTLGVPLLRFFHDYTSTCLRRGKRRWPGDRCRRPLGLSCAAYGCLIGPPLAPGKPVRLMDLPGKIAERNAYRRFDASIVGSRHMRSMLLTNGFDPSRVHMVPYFSRFADEALHPVKKLPDNGRPLELMFSGQAVKGKGLEILMDALAGLEGDWRLTVFSEGPCLSSAKEKAAQHSIADRVSFRGWVNQSALAEAYRDSDVFVLPSIWDDPGPLVGIEALSWATPIVGFAVGGIPDYLIDGETGWLVKDVSVKGLHVGLQSCLNNRAKLPEMGAAGQKRVANFHSAKDHVGHVRTLYETLLSKQNKRDAV